MFNYFLNEKIKKEHDKKLLDQEKNRQYEIQRKSTLIIIKKIYLF